MLHHIIYSFNFNSSFGRKKLGHYICAVTGDQQTVIQTVLHFKRVQFSS